MNKELTTKQSFWLGHIQAAQRSGSSFTDYAAKHKLNVKALYNWALILRRKGALEHRDNAFVAIKNSAASDRVFYNSLPFRCSSIYNFAYGEKFSCTITRRY